MLARRLATILPAMSLAEAVETTRLRRRRGPYGRPDGLGHDPPIPRPHHTISDVGLIGGGRVPMPGEVSRPIMACASWMRSPSFALMCWKS
jgi:magnesium chelatase family protein